MEVIDYLSDIIYQILFIIYCLTDIVRTSIHLFIGRKLHWQIIDDLDISQLFCRSRNIDLKTQA